MQRPVSFIDLHCHTTKKSIDSGLSPDALGKAAVERGLTAICITEHNAIWSREEALVLSEKYDLPVIRGMEVSTDAGHVLTFGLDRYSPEMYYVEALRRIIDSEGGAMVLAHPVRSPGFDRPWEEAPGLFEALESLNGDDRHIAAGIVASLAHSLDMQMTGGSDAHSTQAVARCFTRFEAHIVDEQDLVQALRTGRYHPMEGHMDNPPPEPGQSAAHLFAAAHSLFAPQHHRH